MNITQHLPVRSGLSREAAKDKAKFEATNFGWKFARATMSER